jgi:hypothetical protein
MTAMVLSRPNIYLTKFCRTNYISSYGPITFKEEFKALNSPLPPSFLRWQLLEVIIVHQILLKPIFISVLFSCGKYICFCPVPVHSVYMSPRVEVKIVLYMK